MHLFFWQNILSPHQIPYIKELIYDSRIDSVTLIVAEPLNTERKEMGWNLEFQNNNNFKLIIAPTHKQIIQIYNQIPFSYHFYSGLRAFPFVFNAFKIGLRYPLKRGMIVEPPFSYRKPLFLHFIKTLLFDYRYYKTIDYVFAFGEHAVKWYSFWRKQWKVFEFAYCVEPPYFEANIQSNRIELLYIGSLISRKNVPLIIESLHSLSNEAIHLHIIGDGVEKTKLQKLAQILDLTASITFHGNMNMADIQNEITKYDILILPSYFDGWGAVVNEAIMAGLFVLCSEKCGSKSLINKLTGRVFHLESSENSLKKNLQWCMANINKIREDKEKRHNWAQKINGKNIATYFVDSIFENKIRAPWKI